MDNYLCISGGLVCCRAVGGLVLLLYIFHNATRDISRAFNASRVVISGLWDPVEGKRKNVKTQSNVVRMTSAHHFFLVLLVFETI
jgi:hypothetical protein